MGVQITGLEKNAIKCANWLTGLNYPNGEKIRKKMAGTEFKKNVEQSYMMAQVEILEALLTISKEIDELKDDNAGQNKFDLLVGDLEMLTVSINEEFQKRHDSKYQYKPKKDIEDLKQRVKSWSVSVSEL